MFSSMLCLVLLSSMAVEGVPKKQFPACNTVKSTTVDYNKLIQLSPFNIYQTNEGTYNCSKVVFTGPQPSKVPYAGSSLVIQGSSVWSYDVTVFQNSILSCLECATDDLVNHTTVYANLISSTRASVCFITCAQNGVDYATVLCLGKTQTDFNDITKYLSTNMANAPGIFNAQSNCDQPKACNFFVD